MKRATQRSISSPSSFYGMFFALCLPLVLQNMITLGVNLADNIMLGSFSETALSGAAAVNQVQFVYQQLLMALGDGIVMICSQYWGRQQTGPMKKIMAFGIRIALGIALALFLAVTFFPAQVLHLFTTDAAITAEGIRYLNIIRFSYLFFAVTQICLACLRSVGTVRIAFNLSVQTLIVNCCINYVLIFGHFGAPRLGIAGAAIGTLTARILEAAVALWYLFTREMNLKMKAADLLHIDSLLSMDYIRVTAPMMVVSGLWGLNTAMQTVILGHMTSEAIAANSAASTLFLLVKAMPAGASAASAILIGRKIGEGNLREVKKDAVRLQKIFLTIGICCGIILFFLRIPVLSMYDLADSTRAMANSFLIVLSIITVTMSYQMPTNNGIIRGGGNPGFVVKMDLISIWGIVIPLSLFMAFVVKASPLVVVCCLNADQVFKCVPAFIKANYGSWIRKLTRD